MLSGSAGFLLARAAGRAIRGLNRALDPFGLRSRHYAVLMAAAEHGGLSQREIGSLLGIDPSAVVALVDDLQRAGYVRRDPHPEDRRTRLVVLTDAGHEAFAHASELATEVDGEILAPLDADERAALVRLLRRIATADLRSATRRYGAQQHHQGIRPRPRPGLVGPAAVRRARELSRRTR